MKNYRYTWLEKVHQNSEKVCTEKGPENLNRALKVDSVYYREGRKIFGSSAHKIVIVNVGVVGHCLILVILYQ